MSLRLHFYCRLSEYQVLSKFDSCQKDRPPQHIIICERVVSHFPIQ